MLQKSQFLKKSLKIFDFEKIVKKCATEKLFQNWFAATTALTPYFYFYTTKSAAHKPPKLYKKPPFQNRQENNFNWNLFRELFSFN